jgi:cytochrome P450
MPFTDSRPLAARLERELPPTMPIPSVLQTVACRRWFFSYVERCRSRYGNRFTVYPMDMPPLVFLSDPEDVQEMMTAPPTALHSGAGAALLAPLIGARSFMLCEEDEHKHGRSAVMPAFHRKMVDNHAAMVLGMVEREVASWPLEQAIALHPRIRALMLKVILRAVFVGEDRLLDALHEQLLGSLSVTASFVLQAPQLRHLPGWRSTWKRFVRDNAKADELIFAILRRRREEAGHGDLVDMLLAARNPDGSAMTDWQVRDNLMSMIVAGHETTTAELAWAFQLLAHDRPAQNRLCAELDGGTGEQYLVATVNETLRHRPAFPFLIPRAVCEPIEIGGWTYAPPARLVACTYLIHHDPAFYPKPQAFRPERFLGEVDQAPMWLPWGAGPRSCVGRHLALLEMRAVLREVLTTRVVLPASAGLERERWRSAVLVPHAGSRIVLRRRAASRRAQRPHGPVRATARSRTCSNQNVSVPIGTDF